MLQIQETIPLQILDTSTELFEVGHTCSACGSNPEGPWGGLADRPAVALRAKAEGVIRRLVVRQIGGLRFDKPVLRAAAAVPLWIVTNEIAARRARLKTDPMAAFGPRRKLSGVACMKNVLMVTVRLSLI